MWRWHVFPGLSVKRAGFGDIFVVVLGTVLFLLPSPSHASTARLTFGTDIRFRAESQNHFNAKYYGSNPPEGDIPDNFLLGRFRVGFDYRPSKSVHLALWGQDARQWGSGFHNEDFYSRILETEFSPYTDELELWNTYLEIKKLYDWPFAVKVGRQQICYGDHRVFGPGNWGNTGHWLWDAVKASGYFSQGFVDVYYGRTVIHNPKRFSLNHRHLFESIGFYGHVKLPDALLGIGIEPFSMTKRDTHRHYRGEDGRLGSLDAAYAGVRVYKKGFHGFDFDATYVREFGDFSDDTIQAYGYHLLAAYTVASCPYRPRVSIEYSVGSGDKNPKDGKRNSFDGAFGPKGEPYSRMCLIRWRNMRDAQVNLELQPRKLKWFYLKTELHKFWLDEKKDGWSFNPKLYRDKTGQSGDDVGEELDLVCRFDLPKGNQIQAGYGHFWPGTFVKKVASNKQADWIFVQWEHKFNWKLL